MIDEAGTLDAAVRSNVAARLAELDWTGAQLCAHTGIPAARFNRLMSGAQSFPLQDLETIADSLNVPWEHLIERK